MSVMTGHGAVMSSLSELRSAAAPIADFFEARIAATGLSLIGTLRRDGWPRVSPMELSILDGRLFVGSMPNAVKAQDLQRDPRCCVITPLADKDDLAGEVKLFCRAREIEDPAEWQVLRTHFNERNDFDLGEPGGSHLFELAIEGGAFQRVEGDDWRTTSWQMGQPARERVRNGPLGESRDL
jgi:hypothetical protein